MQKFWQSLVNKLTAHKRLVLIMATAIVALGLAVVTMSYVVIRSNAQYILPNDTKEKNDIGLVLGAGISANGKPYDELKARLDTAASAIKNGQVKKLLLSGDNRFVNYNEPEAMKQYLIEKKGIDENRLVLDYAGRSTYESCERAAKVFEVKKVVIFSAGSHLPRAIYLCRHFGIESYGIASAVEANNSTRRELLARVKAVYNANVLGEPTVLGDPLPIRTEK